MRFFGQASGVPVRILFSILAAVWCWEFYQNYWLAHIPAFGAVAPYLVHLRRVLAAYLAGGTGILFGLVWAFWSGDRGRRPVRAVVRGSLGSS